jgi:cobalt-precorrin-5B (C1)-methyltransferase
MDGGDDPDCTSGLMIYAEVSLKRRKRIVVEGGPGVGTVTRPGLQIPVGESAINRTPRLMITRELGNILDEHECHKGAHVTISAPGGEDVAQKTFNPKLGIVGGISIIGPTGKVKPYSIPATKKSLVLLLDQAKAHGYQLVVMVPGNSGEKAAHRRYSLPAEQVAQMGNYVGYMVREAARRFEGVLVLGHPGKLLKILLDCYNTHCQKSASALPLVKDLVREQFWYGAVEKQIVVSPTVEGVVSSIPPEERIGFFSLIASRIEKRLKGYARVPIDVGVVLVDMDSHCIGCGQQARAWEENGCLRLR